MATQKNDSIALSYGLVPNNLPDADGYHAVASHAGTTDASTIYSRTAARLPGCSAATVELGLNGAFAVAAQLLSERQYRIALEKVTFELAIPGSGTAANEPPSEKPQVVIYPSESLRNAAVGLDTSYVGEDVPPPVLRSVEDIEGRCQGQIPASGLFLLAGVEMSVSRPDESITVVPDAGTAVSATVTADTGLGTSITAQPDSPIPAGPAVVVLVTHGKSTPDGRLLTLKKKVVVVAATPPTPPTPTGDEPVLERGYSEGEGHSDGKVYPYYAFILQGENLTDAEVKIGYVESGTPREETVPDEKLTVTDTTVTIASDCVELEDAITAGGTVTFTVTTPNGSATYEAEVQE